MSAQERATEFFSVRRLGKLIEKLAEAKPIVQLSLVWSGDRRGDEGPE
jgi:hypothetical protein